MSEPMHRKLSMFAQKTGRKKVEIVRIMLEDWHREWKSSPRVLNVPTTLDFFWLPRNPKKLRMAICKIWKKEKGPRGMVEIKRCKPTELTQKFCVLLKNSKIEL